VSSTFSPDGWIASEFYFYDVRCEAATYDVGVGGKGSEAEDLLTSLCGEAGESGEGG
jgi:hypothetical protein